MRRNGYRTYHLIDRVHYGRPAIETIVEEAARLGRKHAFVLASTTLNRQTDVIDRLRLALGPCWAGVHDGIPAHAPREAVVAAAEAARRAGADVIVTVGGGTVTDTGQLVRLCLRHGIEDPDGLEPFRTVVHPDGSRDVPQYDGPVVPQIAVATTLSAAEFNPIVGCTNTRRRIKEIFVHPRLVPEVIILDPAITLHTPDWLWLSTGVRAVDHSVETLCSRVIDDYSVGPAMHSLRLLRRALPRCKAEPGDLDARLDALIGCWLSADHNMAFITTGASHAIGHVLGGTFGVPHGQTSCIMLPPVMRYNKPVNAGQQDWVSEAMGRPGAEAADVLAEFIGALGMPQRLADVGIGPDKFDQIARNCLESYFLHNNPRPIRTVEEVKAVLELAA